MRQKIGLIIGEQDANASSLLVNNIQEVAAKYDYDIFIFSNYGTYDHSIILYAEGEMSVYKIPVLDSFAGFIIDETLFNIEGMAKIVCDYFTEKSGHNVVYLKGKSPKFRDILLDDQSAMKDITKHFITTHGFKDICYMTGRWELQDARARYAGYEEAMQEAGITVTPNMVFYGDYWKNKGDEAVEFFLNERKGTYPEAIVCANDYMASSVIEALLKRNIRVPEDVCVSGYDNEDDSMTCEVPITTMDPDLASMGRAAMETLHQLIKGEEVPKEQKIPGTPIYRQSCGCGKCVIDDTLEKRFRHLQRHYFGVDMSVFMFNGYQVVFDTDSIFNIADKYFNYNFAEQAYICLCDDALDSENRTLEQINEYSQNMVLKRIFYSDAEGFYDSPEETFSRRLILPESYLDTPKPMKYYVNPIHSQNKVYGYMVSIYGEGQWPYHFTQSYTMALGNALDEYNVRKKYLDMEKIKKLYLTDELTGINNRRGFEQAMTTIVDRAKRKKLYLSIASIDMDGLKEINDTYGHNHGDKCLYAVSRALRNATTEFEAVARYGGDEFVALLVSENNPNRHHQFEEELLAEIEKENALLKEPYTLHVSIGVVPVPNSSTGKILGFYQKADKLMYEKKAAYKQTIANN